MSTPTAQQPRTSQQGSATTKRTPVANSQLVSPWVSAATNGLASNLDASAKARIQY